VTIEELVKAPQPWPKIQKFLPPLSSYERKELEESIAKYGVKESIIVWKEKNLIIDGHHRWEITKGNIPQEKIAYFSGTEEAAFDLGLELNFARRHLSNEQKKDIVQRLRKEGFTQEKAANILGIDQSTISLWENEENISNMKNHNAYNPYDLRISIPKEVQEEIFKKHTSGVAQTEIASDFKISQPRVSQIVKIVKARRNKPKPVETPPFPRMKYRCLVIDPPWPVKKIEREERPNQGEDLDYPTMDLDKIAKLPIDDLANSNGCHVYLWITHKFLPDGLELFEKWGVNYQCLLTWVKPTGMTPFSWMYNTEHLLFGRIGNLNLLKNGVKLSFESPVKGHSKKPDRFYEIVQQVSPEPRLDLFAREERQGFDVWGNEVNANDQALP